MGISETMKAVSDPQRRSILLLLKEGRLSAGEVATHLDDISLATVSYHLSILKKAKLIREERYKNYIYYELNTSVFEQLMVWVSQFTEDTNEKNI
jgi:ArsR family transcriptional regulator